MTKDQKDIAIWRGSLFPNYPTLSNPVTDTEPEKGDAT